MESYTRAGAMSIVRLANVKAKRLPPAWGRIEYPVTAGYRVLLCDRARPQLKPFLHSCVCRLQSMVPGRQLNIGEALVALP